MIASCGFLEAELRQYSKVEGVTMAGSVETLGVDLRKNKSQEVGSRRAGKKEKVQCQVLTH